MTVEIGCSYSRLTGACSGSGTADITGSTTTISDILTSFTDGGAALGGGQDVTLAGPLPTNSAATITATETRSACTPASASKSSTDRTTKTSSSSRATGVTGAGTGAAQARLQSRCPNGHSSPLAHWRCCCGVRLLCGNAIGAVGLRYPGGDRLEC
jgi:hypothetical protein